jgi:hypothetical protein
MALSKLKTKHTVDFSNNVSTIQVLCYPIRENKKYSSYVFTSPCRNILQNSAFDICFHLSGVFYMKITKQGPRSEEFSDP